MPAPRHEMQIISAYFVPGRETATLASMSRAGIQLSVLTNALESTDVPAVHAGYARRRKPLLESGVRLFELRRDSATPQTESRWLGGSSASSLHAKTIAVDRTHLFVGSFNFDPRSARLNTELGFVIESPALSARVAQQFEGPIPARAYQVRLRSGQLEWIQPAPSGPVVWTSEPHASSWLRLQVWFLSLLPIEGLL